MASTYGFVAFYRERRVEVWAATARDAQLKAAEIFKARHAYDVTVVLAERDGQQVTHVPVD